MNKHTVVYSYNETPLSKTLLYSHYYIHKHMDYFQNNYTEYKKPGRRVDTVWIHLYKFLENGNTSIMIESLSMVIWGCGWWNVERKQGHYEWGMETLLQVMGMFLFLIVLTVSWVYIYICISELSQIVFGWTEVCLNKNVQKNRKVKSIMISVSWIFL